jgi:hypothetical protein
MKKLAVSLILCLALLVISAGSAFAQEPTPPPSGTVQNILLDIDATTGETSVLVTFIDDTGNHPDSPDQSGNGCRFGSGND